MADAAHRVRPLRAAVQRVFQNTNCPEDHRVRLATPAESVSRRGTWAVWSSSRGGDVTRTVDARGRGVPLIGRCWARVYSTRRRRYRRSRRSLSTAHARTDRWTGETEAASSADIDGDGSLPTGCCSELFVCGTRVNGFIYSGCSVTFKKLKIKKTKKPFLASKGTNSDKLKIIPKNSCYTEKVAQNKKYRHKHRASQLSGISSKRTCWKWV